MQAFVVKNVRGSEEGRSVDCENLVSVHLLPLYMFPFDVHQATISFFSSRARLDCRILSRGFATLARARRGGQPRRIMSQVKC